MSAGSAGAEAAGRRGMRWSVEAVCGMSQAA